MSLAQRAFLTFIWLYRVFFTPLKVMFGLQGCCRFSPTCSRYAEIAVCEHGICKGLWLTGGRLLRCQPFGPSGYDPVPKKSAHTPAAP